ncbi:hypothetical protein [Cryobacterium sp. MDB2-33-2]|uniref:hypothetical protein n=1 Tax=Cryobacterium sp. MDB2-33-2 TaxID=1259179 RepID=UPI00106B4F39|nr:hypothetical protein [Cryobacterium sp. MDB2-33-2]TFC08441.1 hypothetical protein E3O59_08250 [Cryobacterium sp. MDB2-33-2]
MKQMHESSQASFKRSVRLPRTGRFAEGAIMIVLVLTLLNDIPLAITISTGRVLVALGGADGRLPLSHLPQLLQAELREGTQGTLADADLGLRLLAALPTVLHAVTVTAAAILLIGILYRVALGRPFSSEVLRRWRWLTAVLLIGGVLQSLADTGAILYLSLHIGLLTAGSMPREDIVSFLGGDYSIISTNAPQWPIPILLGGIIALALGVAFRAGAQLVEEADGVV